MLASTCTCLAYQKNFKCKHIIGIAMHEMKNDVVCPDGWKSQILQLKQGKGRPAKAVLVLILQAATNRVSILTVGLLDNEETNYCNSNETAYSTVYQLNIDHLSVITPAASLESFADGHVSSYGQTDSIHEGKVLNEMKNDDIEHFLSNLGVLSVVSTSSTSNNMSEIDVFASAGNTNLILSMNVQATAPNTSASQV